MGILIRAAVLMLAIGAGPAAGQMLDRVVAIVEDDVITHSELEQRVRIISKQIEQGGTPPPPRAELVPQVLEHMVVARLQLQLAAQRGVALPQNMVAQEIAGLAQRNNMPVERFREQIEYSGIRFRDFYAYLHEQMLTRQLQQIESRSLVRVTPDEIENFLRLHSDRLQADRSYHLAHILIGLSAQTTPDESEQLRAKAQQLAQRVRDGERFESLALTESDGRNALKGGDLGWRAEAQLPDFAAEAIIGLEIGGVTDAVRSQSGFHLFYLKNKEGGTHIMVNQTRARHILINTNAMIDADEARSRLSALKARVEGGESFAALARSHSDDTASAVDGGDLDWRSPGELDPFFEEQMNRLEVGAVSEPFQTSFGWHILQVQERRQVDETDQALRTRALNHLARSRVNDEIEIWLRRLMENSYIRYVTEEQGV